MSKWEVTIKQYTDPKYKHYSVDITLTTDDIADVQELKDALGLFTAPYSVEIEAKAVEVARCSEN